MGLDWEKGCLLLDRRNIEIFCMFDLKAWFMYCYLHPQIFQESLPPRRKTIPMNENSICVLSITLLHEEIIFILHRLPHREPFSIFVNKASPPFHHSGEKEIFHLTIRRSFDPAINSTFQPIPSSFRARNREPREANSRPMKIIKWHHSSTDRIQ